MSNTLLAYHFKPAEFDCHDGTPYPNLWIPDRLQPLVDTLEVVRAEWMARIHVRSGYRTPEWNAKVGGALHSQHVLGKAADVFPNDTADSAELHALFLDLFLKGKLPHLGGLGLYAGLWVHVDVREKPANGHLAQWTGTGIGSEP